MGIIGKGVIGELTNSVGNITGYNRLGKNIIQSKPVVKASRDSQLQLDNQDKMKVVQAFFDTLSSEWQGLDYQKKSKYLTDLNSAIKLNYSKFDKTGLVVFDSLILASGRRPITPFDTVGINAYPTGNYISWFLPFESTGWSTASTSNVLIINETTGNLTYLRHLGTQQPLYRTFPANEDFHIGDVLHVYMYFIELFGTKTVSNPVYKMHVINS